MKYGKIHAIASLLCLAGMSAAASGAVIAKFDFDSTVDGKTFKDLSGKGHDAVYNRTVTSQAIDPFDTAGTEAVNRSVVQTINDGTSANQTVALLNDPLGIDVSANSAFTIEGWIKPSALPSEDAYLVELTANKTSDPDSGKASDIYLGINTSGQAIAYLFLRNGTPQTLISESAIPLNEWTHLAFSYVLGSTNPTSVGTLYVNAVAAGTFEYRRGLPTGLSGAYLGGNSDKTYGGILGAIDDIRISDVALSASELGYHSALSSQIVPEPGGIALLGLAVLAMFPRWRTA